MRVAVYVGTDVVQHVGAEQHHIDVMLMFSPTSDIVADIIIITNPAVFIGAQIRLLL